MEYPDKRVSKSAIARMMGEGRETLTRYMNANNLVYKLRAKKLEDAMRADGTWNGQ